MVNIQDIYKMLNWKSSPETQSEGMNLARKVNDLSLLIQPHAEPSVWERCAEVLSEKSDDILEPYLYSLLDWLYDLNWPGALTILERLKVFSGKKLKKPFIAYYSMCVSNLNNEYGETQLEYLSELLDNEELKEELPNEIVEDLKKYYHASELCDDE